MVTIERKRKFERVIKKIKDIGLKEEIKKHIIKLMKNPEGGDPLKGKLKGERKIYLRNFRLLYSYNLNADTIHLIDFDKRARIYKKSRR